MHHHFQSERNLMQIKLSLIIFNRTEVYIELSVVIKLLMDYWDACKHSYCNAGFATRLLLTDGKDTANPQFHMRKRCFLKAQQQNIYILCIMKMVMF